MKNMKAMLAGLVLPFTVMAAQAAEIYPDKPIRLVIPYAAGGTTDILGRVLAEKLGQSLGQTIVVENKSGANSMIGTSQVARATPDGYTLLLTSNVVVINEFLYKSPTYHALSDLVPIAPVATTPYFLIVNSRLPVKSVADFVGYVKSHPDGVAFGSSGTGGTPHLVGELFKLKTGTEFLHVPYKGTGPATIDLASGQVQAMFVGLPSVDPFIKDGSMRIVATAESERSEQRPDIPTIKEQGYPGVYASNWFGIIGPAALPPAVTKRLADATAEIVKTNEFRQRMESLGAEPLAISSDQFKALYNADRERWHDLIDANHLKLE